MNLAVLIITVVHAAVILQAVRFFKAAPSHDHDRVVAATLGGLSAALVLAQATGWSSALWAAVPAVAGADLLMAFSFANALVYLALVTSMHQRATGVPQHG